MISEQRQSARKQIRNLLAVILCGVACAFLSILVALHYFGPTGKYIVKNALLSPSLTRTLSYDDRDPKTGGMSRFVFSGILFSYYDAKQGQWLQLAVSAEQYEKLYQLIANDVSVEYIPTNVLKLFDKTNISSLTLQVQTESSAAWQADKKVFQTVVFAAEGDYFRIQLHEEKNSDNWVYFYHPRIEQEVLHTLVFQR